MSTTTLATKLGYSAPHECRPFLMTGCLLLTDLGTLSVCGTVACLSHWLLYGSPSTSAYVSLIPLGCIFLCIYAGLGLYNGTSYTSPEELRRSTIASFLVSVYLLAITLFFPRGVSVVAWPMVIAIVLTTAGVPIARVFVRSRVSSSPWWGYPTIVCGSPQLSQVVFDRLLLEPSFGLKPIARILCEPEDVDLTRIEAEVAICTRAVRSSACAVIVGMIGYRHPLTSVLQQHRQLFSRILVVPDGWTFPSILVSPKHIGDIFGLEVRGGASERRKQVVKRSLDLALSLVCCIVFAPVFIGIAIAIRMSSPGPILYPHPRVGRGGTEFRAWKFRSMVRDADFVLNHYLATHPELQKEWKATHKLKNDPRVTRLGRWLRRSSLDELPQLWNVLKGEMSLVGPRPIVQEEIVRYGDDGFELYIHVRSGLTGLWQVSGRSDTSYQQRVMYDMFYIRNWSVWLDFCILFRTIGTVLSRAGAF